MERLVRTLRDRYHTYYHGGGGGGGGGERDKSTNNYLTVVVTGYFPANLGNCSPSVRSN